MQIDIPDALAPFFEKMTKEDIRRTYAVGLFLMGHLTLPQAAALAHLEEQVLRRQLESHDIPSSLHLNLGRRQNSHKINPHLRMEPTAHDLLMPTPATVTVAIERIIAACQPRAILVFGSRARGRARPDSDLDLCVLLQASVPDCAALRRRLRALLADLLFSKDILVSNPEDFAHWSTRLNSVYQDIATDGFHLWRDGRLDAAAIEVVCR